MNHDQIKAQLTYSLKQVFDDLRASGHTLTTPVVRQAVTDAGNVLVTAGVDPAAVEIALREISREGEARMDAEAEKFRAELEGM